MITHTKAYLRLRKQAKEMWDFTVTVCYAIPSLKEQIRLVRKDAEGVSLPPPDYFNNSMSLDEVQSRSADYRSKLSRYIVLSSFSFFEAYVIDAIAEMMEFHDGLNIFIDRTQQRAQESILTMDSSVIKSKRKLQEPEKPAKAQKYQKYSKELVEAGHKFPSELLASYGVRLLAEKIKNLKSVDIPDLLIQALHCKIDAQRFHQIRDIRNKIAHGRTGEVRLILTKAIKINDDLRNFATTIDKHLIEHYFVLEKYA